MTTTTLARAWAITRSDGYTLGFTDHDRELAFDGINFRPDRGLSAGALVRAAGLSVDNSEARGVLSDEGITEGDILSGRWDRAKLRMWEVDWSRPSDRRMTFRGYLGEVTRLNGAFHAELRGLSEALNQSRGRVYHPRCSASLGDAACGINLGTARFRAIGIAERVEGGRVLELSDLGIYEARWFEGGVLEVTSGTARGLSAKIKNDRALSGGRRHIELWTPLSMSPERGDSIQLTAGCDKSARACRLKFANFLNFRGFPHLPDEDWLVSPQIQKRRTDLSGYETTDLATGWGN